MFGKKKSATTTTSSARAGNLFEGLRRGQGDTPFGTAQRFPSADDLKARDDLRFDPTKPDGKILLGLVDAVIQEAVSSSGGVRSRYATAGTFIGIRDDRHIVSVAGSRGGKSRALLLGNLLVYPGSIICVDPKADLATESAPFRAQRLGQKVYVLDPFGAAGPEAAPYLTSFNPLAGIDGSDTDALIEHASLIADALVVRNPGAKDPHWDDAALQLIEGVVLHVMTFPKYRDARNLGTVYQLLTHKASATSGTEEDDLPELAAEMLENEACEGAVIGAARAHYDREDREESSVLSSVRRHIRFLGYPRIRRVLEDGPVNLGAMQTEPTTIYLSLPATRIGTCAGWLRLFVNLALSAFESSSSRRDYQHQTGRHPTLLCLDEFASLGRLQRVEDCAGLAAGMGCKLWCIVQDLGQLKSLYRDRWETFLGNAGVITFFSNMDLFTLQYIEKRLGSTLIYTPSHSQPTFDASVHTGATGASFAIGSHPLMSVPEIASTFGREDPQLRMLVLLPTIGPVILHRAFYDQHEVLRRIHHHGTR